MIDKSIKMNHNANMKVGDKVIYSKFCFSQNRTGWKRLAGEVKNITENGATINDDVSGSINWVSIENINKMQSDI